MGDTDVRGRFVWHELMTTDPNAGKQFYTAVLGWGTQEWKGEGGMPPYTMFTRGDQPTAGTMELPEDARKMGAPPNWMAYVGTPNVDETVQAATGLGAKVFVPPTDIPTVGRFAVLADPQGAVFAVFTPDGPAGAERPPEVGEFSWHELLTTDHGGALAFYQKLFGWEKTGEHDMGPMGLYVLYGRKGYTLGGMFNKTPDMPMPPNWTLYVRVDDIQQAAARVKAHGGQVINGPMEVPGGDWILQAMDPQGAAFALHQRKAE